MIIPMSIDNQGQSLFFPIYGVGQCDAYVESERDNINRFVTARKWGQHDLRVFLFVCVQLQSVMQLITRHAVLIFLACCWTIL